MQSALRLCEEVRSGGKFFRFFVFHELHHRNIPHRYLKAISLFTEKVYHYYSSIYRESSRTVQFKVNSVKGDRYVRSFTEV